MTEKQRAAARWLTKFFLPPMSGHGESLRAESAAKFEAMLLALVGADTPSPPVAAGGGAGKFEALLERYGQTSLIAGGWQARVAVLAAYEAKCEEAVEAYRQRDEAHQSFYKIKDELAELRADRDRFARWQAEVTIAYGSGRGGARFDEVAQSVRKLREENDCLAAKIERVKACLRHVGFWDDVLGKVIRVAYVSVADLDRALSDDDAKEGK